MRIARFRERPPRARPRLHPLGHYDGHVRRRNYHGFYVGNGPAASIIVALAPVLFCSRFATVFLSAAGERAEKFFVFMLRRDMVVQGCWGGERLKAEGTAVGLFSRVRPHMGFQIDLLCALFSAALPRAVEHLLGGVARSAR